MEPRGFYAPVGPQIINNPKEIYNNMCSRKVVLGICLLQFITWLSYFPNIVFIIRKSLKKVFDVHKFTIDFLNEKHDYSNQDFTKQTIMDNKMINNLINNQYEDLMVFDSYFYILILIQNLSIAILVAAVIGVISLCMPNKFSVKAFYYSSLVACVVGIVIIIWIIYIIVTETKEGIVPHYIYGVQIPITLLLIFMTGLFAKYNHSKFTNMPDDAFQVVGYTMGPARGDVQMLNQNQEFQQPLMH